MKLRHTLIIALGLFLAASIAYATSFAVNALDFANNTTEPVGTATHGKIRYNSSTPGFEQSLNGAAWTTFGGGAFLPLAGGTMTGAITLSGTQLGTYSLGGTPTLAANMSIASGVDITAAGGTTDFDLSASNGITRTGTGAVTLQGSTALVTGKTLTTTYTGLTNTTTSQVIVQNTTAGTGGSTVQNSPAIELDAHYYSPGLVGDVQEKWQAFVDTTGTIGSYFSLFHSRIIGGTTTSMPLQILASENGTAQVILTSEGNSGVVLKTQGETLQLGSSTPVSIGGALSVLSGFDITASGGVSDINYSASSGVWTTPTGGITGPSGSLILQESGGTDLTITDETLTCEGNVVPKDDNTWSLGSVNKRWTRAWLTDATLRNDTVAAAQTFGKGMSIGNTTAATDGAQKYSPMLELLGKGWDTDEGGGSSVEVRAAWQARPVQSASPTADMVLWSSVNGGAYSERLSIGAAAIKPVNGATSLGDGSHYFSTLYTNAVTGTYTLAGTPTLGASLSVGSGFDITAAGGASDFDYSASSGTTKTGTGAVSINGDTTIASGKNFTPAVDATSSNGDSTHQWKQKWSRRYAGGEFVVAFSATPSFDAANGAYQQITLTANITSWTVPAGLSGEIITIQFIQDGTGGWTLAGFPANVLLATGGVYVLTTTANRSDTVTLRYNSNSAKWLEIARAQNCGG